MTGMAAKAKKAKATVEYLDEKTVVDRSTFNYYLGIDPSYSSTGIVLLPHESREIEPLIACTIKAGKPGDTFIARMNSLITQLETLLKDYPASAILVVMEGAAFAAEFGAFKLGKLSGVLEYWLATHGYTYYLVAPPYVKKVACSNGAATKVQVINGVRRRWKYKHKSNDVNDAYVMARIAQGSKPLIKNSLAIKTKKKERIK